MGYFYVICPVGSDATFPQKKLILEEVGHNHELAPFFPLEHLEHRQEFLNSVALARMRAATFVLADLSLERPSCYFELGLAQAAGAAVRIIATLGTPIHQVGEGHQVAYYSGLEEYRSCVNRVLDEEKRGHARG